MSCSGSVLAWAEVAVESRSFCLSGRLARTRQFSQAARCRSRGTSTRGGAALVARRRPPELARCRVWGMDARHEDHRSTVALRVVLEMGQQAHRRFAAVGSPAVDVSSCRVWRQSTQVKVFNSFSASWIYEVLAGGREVLKGFSGDGKFVRRSGRADCAARSLAFCRSRHPVEAGATTA